jgi:hypothetical protein
LIAAGEQGCQMVHFRTKNSNFGNFIRPWNGRFLYFCGHLEVLRLFDYLAFVVSLVHFSIFGLLYQQKSGNPAGENGKLQWNGH